MRIFAAVIGTGIGKKHIEAIDKSKNSFVKIICEKNKSKLKKLKKEYPQKICTSKEDEIFNDKQINLVSIASYDDDHFRQIIKSVKNNKHIIIEKPMCLTLQELKKIRSMLHKSKIKISSNLVLRENDLFKYLKHKIDKNKVYYIEADYIWGRPYKLFQWRSKIKKYSVILGAAIHMIDLIMWFLEDRPKFVTTIGSDRFTKNTSFKKKNCVTLILEFKNDVMVKVNVNSLGIYPHFHEVKVYQKNKTFIHNLQGSYEFNKDKIRKINKNYPDRKNRKNLIKNFIENLLSNNLKKKTMSLKEQFDLMSVCFAAEKSLNDNKKIKINYFRN